MAAQDRAVIEAFGDVYIAVYTHTKLAYGMARMWEMNLGDHEGNVAIFTDLKSAREWMSLKVGEDVT